MLDELKRQWRSGSVVIRLILVNVAVFLAMVAAYVVFLFTSGNGAMAEALRDHYVVHWLRSTADLHELVRRPWTVITYMFTHTGVWHLFWNMVLLYFGGRLFEGLLGGRRLLGHYLLAGISGFALYAVLSNLMPGLNGGAVGSAILGASAGVIGVFVGVAAYQPHMLVNVILVGPVKLMYVAAIFVLLDFVGIGSGDGVAHEAHIGGALYGLLAAMQLKRGTDWSLGFVNALDKVVGLFTGRRGGRMRVEKHYDRRGKRTDADYNVAKKEKQARVDSILDKISRSGYDSLSKEEKDFLFKAGNS